MTARSRLALAAIALLAVGGACSKGGGADAAGRLTVDGRARVTAPGGKAEEERGSRTVKFGERIDVVEGTATLRLDGDRQLELRAGTNLELQAAGGGGKQVAKPLLLQQDLLVQAAPGARLTVATEGGDVIVTGGAKLSRGPVLVVSSYDGVVELRAGDRSATVPALREVSVGADGSLGGVVPLTYDVDDAWDRRFLSEAIEVGNELEARSKGFTAQLGASDGHTPEFLVGLLPGLAGQPDFLGLFDAGRAPGESLVGAAIALDGTRGTFGERWAGIFGFRDQGAQWGLVALDQGVSRAPLLAAVDAAISRGPRPFETIPLPGAGAPQGGLGLPAGGGAPGTTTLNATPGSPATAPVPTTVPPPTPPNPNVGPINTGIPILDNTINSLVETLSGLLRSLGGT